MTLIEILLAIYIGILIFLAVTSIYFLGVKFFKTGSDRLEIVQNGRVSLDRLTRELRQTQEITTFLPATKDEPGNPPPSEIQFQDGHQEETLQYFRYYLNGAELWKQTILYYFAGEPDVYVNWNAIDIGGNPPSSTITEKIVGEYFSSLQFYGETPVAIEASLAKNQVSTEIRTIIYGRNTQ
ncbi:hypothetical protein KKI23_02130 [Patescibacteria group bacterium]|nr:hypothetical protein [Patescibacteria group bacterium]